MKYIGFIACTIFGVLFAQNDDVKNYHSTYLEKKYLDFIDHSQVHCILEIGSHHGMDAILLQQHYHCPIYAFECNPVNIQRVKRNIQNYPDIHLVEKAVWKKSGIMDFYSCLIHPGSSSCYLFDFLSLSSRSGRNLDFIQQHYRQKKIQVQATRLDDWLLENKIEKVDLICMDIQGATLPALKSLGKYLPKIKYVITEVEYQQVYQGEDLFPSICAFMQDNGFACLYSAAHEVFNDVLFINQGI